VAPWTLVDRRVSSGLMVVVYRVFDREGPKVGPASRQASSLAQCWGLTAIEIVVSLCSCNR